MPRESFLRKREKREPIRRAGHNQALKEQLGATSGS
jgi:hypothetical protein